MHQLGQTRSANRRDHLFLTPDTFIRTPLPGLTGGLAIVHVAPAAGAAFTQMKMSAKKMSKRPWRLCSTCCCICIRKRYSARPCFLCALLSTL